MLLLMKWCVGFAVALALRVTSLQEEFRGDKIRAAREHAHVGAQLSKTSSSHSTTHTALSFI
jgi:hypothetical protein